MNDSFYEAIGGHDFFESLVSGFYEGIESDPVLRPMYPDGDLTQDHRLPIERKAEA